MAIETCTCEIKNKNSILCPYCGEPLRKWNSQGTYNRCMIENNTGYISYCDKCEKCGKRINYYIYFATTYVEVKKVVKKG